MPNKIIIIDGNSLLFRAFYATYNEDKEKLMHSHDGTPTNAIYAFSNMIVGLLKTLKKGDGIFVAFDAGKHTFRHQQYEGYKAQRKPLDESLKIQLPLARDLLDSLNITHYEDERFEADDIAGILAKEADSAGFLVEIYTSDKDYLQLINDRIMIKLIKRGLKDIKEMTPQSFYDEWGIRPIQIVDYKGLMGDASDNLKGIPLVGDKTAKKLIQEYGSLEEIIKAAPTFNTKIGQNIVTYQDQGKMCKDLAIIRTHETLSIDVNDTIYSGYDFKKISNFASSYDLNTLLNKLPKNLRLATEENKVTYKEITSLDDIKIESDFGLAVYEENVNYHDAKLYGITISLPNGENYYISYDFLKNSGDLQGFLSKTAYKKFVFDHKKTKYILEKHGIKLDGVVFDLLLASYLIDSGLSNDIGSILSYFNIDISYADKVDSLFNESENGILLRAATSHYSLALYDQIKDRLLSLNQWQLFTDIELPLSTVLEEIEYEGFPVDKSVLLNLKEDFSAKLNAIEQDIYNLVGEEFNIASPKQVAVILYDKLGLKSNRDRSTSSEYLSELLDDHPVVSKILEYRKYAKLISTYIDGIIPYIHEDNKLHATFNQALTSTGRLSSSEPNLQNITIRDDESKLIRKAFTYNDKNLKILSLDYSQIELRILAHLSGSKTLIDAFNSDEDIHEATARKIFHIDKDLPVDPHLRRQAKTVNFGIIYGISDWGLAEQLEIPVKEAKAIIESFYEAFPEIKSYLESIVKNTEKLGYTSTIFNRRRYLPDINSTIFPKRNFAKRAAMNAPIQGSAADLIKIAMIKVKEALESGNYEAKIINQIHDEILIKVPDNEKDDVLKLVKNIMENCVKLNVKLEVDGGYADNWHDVK